MGCGQAVRRRVLVLLFEGLNPFVPGGKSSMEKWWFNSMMFNRGLEYRCGLSKSIDTFGPIENNSVNEDTSILTDMDNTILTDSYNTIQSPILNFTITTS
ncbi:acetyl-coA carboxylase carboxyltransferase beta subunit [Medicago truncatula]|uniref:Acetyl-coA carboxylase carboxyltransferase beta subunit n=1 Tax=Medicago truncatula TaxID=3880 RepID=G7J5E2_MEDTR|nr:acetyl-coA carboxylase carboxyltransferase beta subunit [Medicago truncatula]